MLRPLALALALSPAAALAEPMDFTGWTEQRLKLLSSNDYTQEADRLGIVSENTVSLLWTRLPETLWGATTASWDWSVTEGVAATDLSVKGGDDRDIAIYFLWIPSDTTAEAGEADIRSLIGRDDVRIIQYAWGGSNPLDEPIPSPYGVPGTAVTIPLHDASTGEASESVDLAADYARAFDGEPGALVGMAVSADSDDTEARIDATVSNLSVQ